MEKVAACYVVYENSGFLEESVRRIYSLVDNIFFFLNFKPWNGQENEPALLKSYSDIINMVDPNNKIQVISGYWNNETEQRNYCNTVLREKGISWNFIIDDDEMYNYKELEACLKYIRNDPIQMGVYLIGHKVYWRNTNWVMNKSALALPAFLHVDRAHFNSNRMTTVTGFNWHTFPYDFILTHHYSYIRENALLKRKINNFSHASEFEKTWITEIWEKWMPEFENLGPNPLDKGAFKKVIPYNKSAYSQLEPLTISKGSNLENLLKKSNSFKTPFQNNFLQRFVGILMLEKFATDIALLGVSEEISKSILDVISFAMPNTNVNIYSKEEEFLKSYKKYNLIIEQDDYNLSNKLHKNSFVIRFNFKDFDLPDRIPYFWLKDSSLVIYEY